VETEEKVVNTIKKGRTQPRTDGSAQQVEDIEYNIDHQPIACQHGRSFVHVLAVEHIHIHENSEGEGHNQTNNSCPFNEL